MQGGAGPSRLSHNMAGLRHDTAERKAVIRPSVGTTRPAARAHGLTVGVRSRYKALYRDIAAGTYSLAGHVTIQLIVS